MAPRNWVPVTLPKRTWRLARPLAPGVKPAYLMPPTPGVSRPGDPPGEAYPITEAQAAYAYRLRRERADRAARGEPEPETRHDRHHRRLEEETAAREAARALGVALRTWREARGLSQTELAQAPALERIRLLDLRALADA